MTDQPSFSIEQAIGAQRRLRSSLGLGDERFPLPAFVGMISDEIELMRKAGRTDADIVNIIADATGERIAPEELARHYAPPEQRRHD